MNRSPVFFFFYIYIARAQSALELGFLFAFFLAKVNALLPMFAHVHIPKHLLQYSA